MILLHRRTLFCFLNEGGQNATKHNGTNIRMLSLSHSLSPPKANEGTKTSGDLVGQLFSRVNPRLSTRNKLPWRYCFPRLPPPLPPSLPQHTVHVMGVNFESWPVVNVLKGFMLRPYLCIMDIRLVNLTQGSPS